MRSMLIMPLLLLLTSIVFSQTTLYNQDGISLSYVTSVEKSVYCKKENKIVNFIKLHYTVTNNSGKAIRVNSWLQMESDNFAFCITEDDVFHYIGTYPDQDGRFGILTSGNSYSGDVGNWYYESDASPAAWFIKPEFPETTPELKVNINLASTHISKVPTVAYGISQQGDNVVNPKPQTNYSQQQKAQDKATANAMKAWQNAYEANIGEMIRINNSTNNSQDIKAQQEKRELEKQKIAEQEKQEITNLQKQEKANENTSNGLSNAVGVAGNTIMDIIVQGHAQKAATAVQFISEISNDLYNVKITTPYYEVDNHDYGLLPGIPTFSVSKLISKPAFNKDLKQNNVSPSTDNFVNYFKSIITNGELFTVEMKDIRRTLKCINHIIDIWYSENYINVSNELNFTGYKPNGSVDTYMLNSLNNEIFFSTKDILDVKYIGSASNDINGNNLTENGHYEIQLKTGETVVFFADGDADSILSTLRNYTTKL